MYVCKMNPCTSMMIAGGWLEHTTIRKTETGSCWTHCRASAMVSGKVGEDTATSIPEAQSLAMEQLGVGKFLVVRIALKE